MHVDKQRGPSRLTPHPPSDPEVSGESVATARASAMLEILASLGVDATGRVLAHGQLKTSTRAEKRTILPSYPGMAENGDLTCMPAQPIPRTLQGNCRRGCPLETPPPLLVSLVDCSLLPWAISRGT
jgi:hypothetical protein